jgi:hypothetical protein
MAPDDLNLTVDFNDASFEDESSDDAYIPETWASNRNSTGDNASMAVLGAGSEAAEFVFEFDDVSFDDDPDTDISIGSDMEGGSRVLRVDTSDNQGSFKFSSVSGDTHSVGTDANSFYGEVAYSGNASLGVTDAFLTNVNDSDTNSGSTEKGSPVHVGAVSGATAMLSLGQTASGKVDLNFSSSTLPPQSFQVYKSVQADGSDGHFVALNMNVGVTDKNDQLTGESSIAFVPISQDETGEWNPDIENDGWVYTGRGGNIDGVKAVEKVWIDLDAIGMTFGPDRSETNAQERIDGDDYGVELVGDSVSTVDIGGFGTADKFGIRVDNNLYVDGVTEIKLNDGGSNVRIEADGISDAYTLVSGSGDDLIDFEGSSNPFVFLEPGEDYVTLSYQAHESVRLTLSDMVQADDNGGFTLVEHTSGGDNAGDRVKGAIIDEIILSDGADIVNIEGSAFGAGTQQVLRPGYTDYSESINESRVKSHDMEENDSDSDADPFTFVNLQNVEIIRMDDGAEYHLLQGGTGTLDDFYYYASDDRASISGLGDDRSTSFIKIMITMEDHLVTMTALVKILFGLIRADQMV